MSQAVDLANTYLGGAQISFAKADALWRQLKKENEISIGRMVLECMRKGQWLLDPGPASQRPELCQQHAELTSKDVELSAAIRHDAALDILKSEFDLANSTLDGDAETLGIAGGICKRRWIDLGQYEDLVRAAEYYTRGAKGPVGNDGYAQINAAFMQDLVAHASGTRRDAHDAAISLRTRILTELTPFDRVSPKMQWWNAATRAEALFGLGRYQEAISAIRAPQSRPDPWQLQSTAQQLATLAHIRQHQPFKNPEIRGFFDALMLGATQAAQSTIIGKVGLALSGGGFRASLYHLGVFARLAELDVLRHVEVLSCVSGGSIVGACYWLMLRERLLTQAPLKHSDYIGLVQGLIQHFTRAVSQDIRRHVQASKLGAVLRLLRGGKGLLDSEKTTAALEQFFYAPLWKDEAPLYMHNLVFNPKDHDARLTGSDRFNPTKHNWLRRDKVPVLVLNATTVNTGHAWQFTPTWMGESPWAIHPTADSVPRLQWHEYVPGANWQISVARAVAASACVPLLFEPHRLDEAYEGYHIQLVDGGMHDNQGTVALLAHNCKVLIVSDAAGQLLLEERPQAGLIGLGRYATRTNSALMERVRLANYGDLAARVRTRLLRGLMFLHLKEGLEADPVRLKFSQQPYMISRIPLSPLGVRKDFQKAIAELRTDLDAFSTDEAYALMACGYQMSSTAFERDLGQFDELYETPASMQWPFQEMLQEIRSTDPWTARRESLLAALTKGSTRQI
jgi:predicted acylesterase/phospholipase RssA